MSRQVQSTDRRYPKLVRWFAVAILACLWSLPVNAETGLPASLLRDGTALKHWVATHNPNIESSRQRVAQAEADVSAAGVWQNPEVDVGVSQLAVGKPTPSTQLSYWQTPAVRVGLSQTIELGKRSHHVAAASHRKRAAGADYETTLNAVVADARDALARIVMLRARQALLEQRLTSAREVTSFGELRLQRGDISVSDRDRLALEEASVTREKSENEADLALAIATCGELLTADCGGDLGDMEDLDTAAPVLGDVAADLDTSKLPEVRTLGQLQLAAREDAVYFRNHALPDPTVSVSYTRDFYVWAGDQPHTFGVNVTLPIPVFDSGANQARAAEALAKSIGSDVAARKLKVTSGVRGLLAKRAGLEKKLEIIVRQLLPRSESVVAASETAYRQGQSSMTDLLLVRRDHLSIKLDEIDTRYALFTVRNELRVFLGLDGSL